MSQTVFSKNELNRLFALSELNLDFSDIGINLQDLTTLAAKLSGMEISFVNIIDSVTQWTLAAHGYDLEQMPREESVCQYTILQDDNFEVKDLSEDERFRNRPYVSGAPGFRYYYGIPLSFDNHKLGALCVLDTHLKQISPEKREMLQLIAAEVVQRLRLLKQLHELQESAKEAKQNQHKALHDIRGPLSGIMQLSELIAAQSQQTTIASVLELINMIHTGSKSLLDLADNILGNELKRTTAGGTTSYAQFSDKLHKLYQPQATAKEITLKIEVEAADTIVSLPVNKLLQIVGNLISNALKFTERGGTVSVQITPTELYLEMRVSDTGIGLSAERIEALMNPNTESTGGSEGEQGFGFGLQLVKHLLEQLKGTLSIRSEGVGAQFTVNIPLAG